MSGNLGKGWGPIILYCPGEGDGGNGRFGKTHFIMYFASCVRVWVCVAWCGVCFVIRAGSILKVVLITRTSSPRERRYPI